MKVGKKKIIILKNCEEMLQVNIGFLITKMLYAKDDEICFQ